MNKNKLTISILGVLMITFTFILDYYIIQVLGGIDYIWAFITVVINILSIGLIYTILLYLKSSYSNKT